MDTNYRRTSTLLVQRDGGKRTEWIYARIEDFAKRLNKHFWNFELGQGVARNDGALSCRLHESMQILKYRSSNSGFYDTHMDMGIHGYQSRRKLSVTVQLSPPDSYAGGDLELIAGKNHVAMPRLVGRLCSSAIYCTL